MSKKSVNLGRKTPREINSILCDGIGVMLKTIENNQGRQAMADEVREIIDHLEKIVNNDQLVAQ